MNIAWWEDAFVERSSNRTRKYICLFQRVSVWIRCQHFEERVEIVRRLIDVIHKDRSIDACALSQGRNRYAHGGQRVLSLRRTQVGNHHGMIATINFNASNRVLQVR